MELQLFIILFVLFVHNLCFALNEEYDYGMKNDNDDISLIYKIFNRNGEDNDSYCQDKLCVNVPDYPEKRIRNLLKKTNINLSYFGTVFKTDQETTLRFGTDSKNCCQTKTTPINPQKFKSRSEFIVNIEPYLQIINYEVCRNPNDTQESICGFSPYILGYQYKCEQKYTQIKLLVADLEKDEIRYEEFPVPSGCVMKAISNKLS